MAIANEITRLQTAKSDIKTAIEGKGVMVPGDAKIDVYYNYISAIQSGVPQEEYDELLEKYNTLYDKSELILSGTILGQVGIGGASNHLPIGGGSSALYSVGNTLFSPSAIGSKHFSYSGGRLLADGCCGIVYKNGTGQRTGVIDNAYEQIEDRSANNADTVITRMVLVSDTVINYTIEVYATNGDRTSSTTTYNWTIGTNTFTKTTEQQGESLDKYKLYDVNVITSGKDRDMIASYQIQ